ncbi:MAG: hypothetical protein KAG96_00095 [Ichthyobacteriaceae bacterium]|nr:hypothetical protein [Ichthyobacteriaceae bacterium]
MKLLNILIAVIIVTFSSCTKNPDINNTMLDGDVVFDPSTYNPENFLISLSIKNPTAEQKNMPVFIASHGYSATTFEWDQFKEYTNKKKDILVSQVLLKGHGTTYNDFKKSTWKDWKTVITKEYNALKNQGYKNINFIGSSTSCTLALQMIKSGEMNGIKNYFFVDPIIIPSDKLITIVGAIGPMLGYIETNLEDGEQGKWYQFRPQETVNELMKLMEVVRKDLQDGFKLPKNSKLKVYKSTNDPTADAVSAVLIYKGLKMYNGGNVNVDMIDSGTHVMTRLNGLDKVTDNQVKNQQYIFNDVCNIAKALL